MRLQELGFGSVELLLRRTNSGQGIGDVRFRRRDVARCVDGGDRNVDIQGLGRSLGVGDVGASLVHGNLVVARVNFYEDIAGLDVLVVVHIDLCDVAGNARADGHHVAVNFRVVG